MCNSSLRGVGTVRISEKFDQKDDYLESAGLSVQSGFPWLRAEQRNRLN